MVEVSQQTSGNKVKASNGEVFRLPLQTPLAQSEKYIHRGGRTNWQKTNFDKVIDIKTANTNQDPQTL